MSLRYQDTELQTNLSCEISACIRHAWPREAHSGTAVRSPPVGSNRELKAPSPRLSRLHLPFVSSELPQEATEDTAQQPLVLPRKPHPKTPRAQPWMAPRDLLMMRLTLHSRKPYGGVSGDRQLTLSQAPALCFILWAFT